MSNRYFLGIEIGGTKLQFGVGTGQGTEFVAFERREVRRADAARGILQQIEQVSRQLLARYPIERVGYGFGGPVWGKQGVVQKSHQVSDWDNFPLVSWTKERLGLPARLGNDCDVAALAEACFGAGQNHPTLFYVTVGTGIGGGWVVQKAIQGTHRPASAEIGHLRPGLDARSPEDTLESLASGLGLETRWQTSARMHSPEAFGITDEEIVSNWNNLTARQIIDLARQHVEPAETLYHYGLQALGWGIAQMITLLAPDIVVIGGGVSLAGEELFFKPLRQSIEEYVFPPLRGQTPIVPAALGENAVVHGALALAASSP